MLPAVVRSPKHQSAAAIGGSIGTAPQGMAAETRGTLEVTRAEVDLPRCWESFRGGAEFPSRGSQGVPAPSVRAKLTVYPPMRWPWTWPISMSDR